ncbi:MAG: hypothetical protein ACPHF4_08260, partial [Rubripirellula sp.]
RKGCRSTVPCTDGLPSGDGNLCSFVPVIGFGLVTETEMQELAIHCPSGERQVFVGVAARLRCLLIENQVHS